MPEVRKAEIERKTKETSIHVILNLDGSGEFKGSVGVPFFEHMLDLFTKHGLFDLTIEGKGDIEVDFHHTVEDVGICIGQAFKKALGDKKGIARYGGAFIPMESALAHAVIDFCNRPYLKWLVESKRDKIGEYDAELTEEFFRAFAMNAAATLHIRLLFGENMHHIHEAIFKACGRAIGDAARIDPRVKGVLSTKGVI
ncbi:imidazoleglycerol-phosphate dehydratase HisB [Candidatus Sumerlaeota bacterium]|nr:imidazoleglycerol-phosphate dehydratase HisB [Candidatus Sumerlaeota bacterium]